MRVQYPDRHAHLAHCPADEPLPDEPEIFFDWAGFIFNVPWYDRLSGDFSHRVYGSLIRWLKGESVSISVNGIYLTESNEVL